MNHTINWSFILHQSVSQSFLLGNWSLVVHSSTSEATTSHVVSHVACVRCLWNVLLLEAFWRYLLCISLMVGSTSTHSILESFLRADWSLSTISWNAGGSSSSRAHWHAWAGLTSWGLDVVVSCCHSNSWWRLKLFNRLSISNTNCWVRALLLLIGTVPEITSWLLSLVLVHIAWSPNAHGRTCFLELLLLLIALVMLRHQVVLILIWLVVLLLRF